jgi:hypothetical protein
LDFLPDREFHPLFKRVSQKINLKGCETKQDIDGRLKSRINRLKNRKRELRKHGYSSGALDRNREQWVKLLDHNFGGRTMDEAIARPRGIEGLTLKYGASKASEILYRRSRSRLRRKRQSLRDRRRLRGISG